MAFPHPACIREARDTQGAARLACLDPGVLMAAFDVAHRENMAAFWHAWAERDRDAGRLVAAAAASRRAQWWNRLALDLLADPR